MISVSSTVQAGTATYTGRLPLLTAAQQGLMRQHVYACLYLPTKICVNVCTQVGVAKPRLSEQESASVQP